MLVGNLNAYTVHLSFTLPILHQPNVFCSKIAQTDGGASLVNTDAAAERLVLRLQCKLVLLPLQCETLLTDYFSFEQICPGDGKKDSPMREPATSLSKKVSFI